MPDVRPTIKDLTLKTVARLRARGPGELRHLVADRLREARSSEDRLVILVRNCSAEKTEGGPLVLRRATADDADAYARFIGTDSASTFARRLSDDTWCYLVSEGYRVLHATWCTTAAAWTRELGAYLAPPRGDAYVYESFTRADARGKGVYPFALRGIAGDLYVHGKKCVWVAVEERNEPSLRAVTKAGFRQASAIRFGRRWGRVWVQPDQPMPASESLHITANPTRHGE